MWVVRSQHPWRPNRFTYIYFAQIVVHSFFVVRVYWLFLTPGMHRFCLQKQEDSFQGPWIVCFFNIFLISGWPYQYELSWILPLLCTAVFWVLNRTTIFLGYFALPCFPRMSDSIISDVISIYLWKQHHRRYAQNWVAWFCQSQYIREVSPKFLYLYYQKYYLQDQSILNMFIL